MAPLYSINFPSTKEEMIFTHSNQKEIHPLGTLLCKFLAADFSSHQNQLSQHRPPAELRLLVPQIAAEISKIHPLLKCSMVPLQNPDHDHLGWMKNRLSTFIFYQEKLTEYVNATILIDSSNLSPLQRYLVFLRDNPIAAQTFMINNDKLRVERKLCIGNSKFIPYDDTQTIPDSKRITSSLVITSKSIKAILILCLEQMIENEYLLKHCEHCGHFFHPYSKKSLYCDFSTDETGKTCKQIAAAKKHNAKRANDEGIAYYEKQKKAYSMRVYRAPSVYKQADFNSWKTRAQVALDFYTSGKLSLDVFKEILTLPDAKTSETLKKTLVPFKTEHS